MRVTNGMMVNNLMRNLNKNLGRMEKTQQQLSSGKKFVNPSDDPIGVSRSLRLNTEIATMDQYKRNADDVKSWLSTTETAVGNINDLLMRAKELTVQAINETNSITERAEIKAEITELKKQLIQIGNTTYAGSSLFSGFKTDKPLLTEEGKYDIGGGKLTADEVIEINIGVADKIGENFVGQRLFGLFTLAADLDTTPAESLKQRQSITSSYLGSAAVSAINNTDSFVISYGGDTTINFSNAPYADLNVLKADINAAVSATGVTVSVVDNKLVFEAEGEFSINLGAEIGIANSQESVSRVESGNQSQLIAVFDQLINDLGSDNTAGINSALSRIEKQSDNVNTIRAEIGVKTNRIELTTNRIEDDTLNLKELMSKNEDADIAKVIMNLKMEEYVYQASLSGGAKIIQPTLVDFIR